MGGAPGAPESSPRSGVHQRSSVERVIGYRLSISGIWVRHLVIQGRPPWLPRKLAGEFLNTAQVFSPPS